MLSNLNNCCGCSACVLRCPKRCITLVENNEGFLYPSVDSEQCTKCGLCEKTCPILNDTEERLPLKVYAAINKNETIRQESSSGGVFTSIAEKVIEKKGIVFGARFDEDWQVSLDCVDNIEELKIFRGSKYVQAKVGESFVEVEKLLKVGKFVLFSGTPCQIAGLRKFLRHDYENLLTVDFVCHGVPSPKVWRRYLKELVARKCEKNTVLFSSNKQNDSEGNAIVNGISFRDKSFGWKKYSFVLRGKLTKASAVGEKNSVLFSAIHREDAYMRAFLSDLTLRPSCYDCHCKSGKSGSDITIADFWGIQHIDPDLDDDKGISLVMLNTLKGDSFYSALDVESLEQKYEDAVKYNLSIVRSVSKPSKRDLFWKKYYEYDDFERLVNDVLKRSFKDRVNERIKQIIRKSRICTHCFKY